MMTLSNPLQLLETVFGYRSFMGQQEAIIQHLLGGGDAVVLMPTGGGKSLCYQIPALICPGVGIVVSPLISLMQDQVNALLQVGVRAAFLNSTLSAQEAWKVEQKLVRGDLDLLYVAPERLVTPRFMQLLEQANLALFAIDEAHCVSQWGHDFRPEYLQLNVLHEKFPRIPRIALTATADESTRREIVERLHLQDATLFVSGFDRPNIRYRVLLKDQGKVQLVTFIRMEHPHDAGIVYCLSRSRVEEIAQWLTSQGFEALPYHAGLDRAIREQNQRTFMHKEGTIIVATIAFGMGIDKPNVRFVAHLDIPKSVEAYYQETGRAGRDGLPATAWMAYGLGDVMTLRQMLAKSEAGEERKRVEQIKLTAMLGYCETTRCRRQVLLKYFGERLETPCQNCDTCLEPIKTWEGTEVAKTALTCVQQTGQRFGTAYLVDVLLGKQKERIQQFRHDHSSSYGAGRELTESQWHSVYRQLVAAGLLTVDIDGYGGLQLTADSWAVMNGHKTVQFRHDPDKKRSTVKSSAPASSQLLDDEPNNILWEALRARRLQFAQAQKVPPYVILHDATLTEMVRSRPASLDELNRISGWGKVKLERYGQAFIEVLAQHQPPAAQLSEPSSEPVLSCISNKPVANASHTIQVTSLMLRQGLSPDEIAKQRGLQLSTILFHLASEIEQGNLDVHQALPLPEQDIRRIEDTILSFPETQRSLLKPLFDALNGAYDYGILRCVRAGLLRKLIPAQNQ